MCGVGLCADQSDMVTFELKGKRRCENSPSDSREDCSRQRKIMDASSGSDKRPGTVSGVVCVQ